MIVQFITTTII